LKKNILLIKYYFNIDIYYFIIYLLNIKFIGDLTEIKIITKPAIKAFTPFALYIFILNVGICIKFLLELISPDGNIFIL